MSSERAYVQQLLRRHTPTAAHIHLNRSRPPIFRFSDFPIFQRAKAITDPNSLYKGPRDTLSAPEEDMGSNDSEIRAIIQFLHEVENLKRLARSGWQLKKIPEPESVADHSHRLTIMAFFAEVRRFYHPIYPR